jgi:hypothetical protein
MFGRVSRGGAKRHLLQKLIIGPIDFGLLAADRWPKVEPKKSTVAVNRQRSCLMLGFEQDSPGAAQLRP